jgi:hypothetical protein
MTGLSGSNVVLHRAVFIKPVGETGVTCQTEGRYFSCMPGEVLTAEEARVRYRPRLLANVA